MTAFILGFPIVQGVDKNTEKESEIVRSQHRNHWLESLFHSISQMITTNLFVMSSDGLNTNMHKDTYKVRY